MTNTKNEHFNKNGFNFCNNYRQRGNIYFFDKLENKMKNVWVKGRCLLYQAKRREIASKGRYEIQKTNKFFITIERSIEKHINNTFLKMNIPMIRKNYFINIGSNRDYIYNFCKNPFEKLQKHCCEWYQYNLIKINTAFYEDVEQNNLIQLMCDITPIYVNNNIDMDFLNKVEGFIQGIQE